MKPSRKWMGLAVLAAAGLALGALAPRAEAAAKQMQITFGGYTNRSEVLTNFPVLVVLSNNVGQNFTFADFVTTNGTDLRFGTNSTPTTNSLNYEVESWNTNAGQASYVWVQVPLIPTNGTGSIWANWGNTSASNQLPCTTNGAVWTNGYCGVWHMNEPNARDSTTYRNNGTAYGNVTTNGMFGTGQRFFPNTIADASTWDYITIPNSASLQNVQEGNYTLELWFQPRVSPPGTITDNASYGLLMKEGYHEGLAHNSSSNFNMTVYTNGTQNVGVSRGPNPPGTFYHVAAAADRSGGVLHLSVNGVSTTRTFAVTGGFFEYGTMPWKIGTAKTAATGWGWPADGIIDEVRISGVARSSNWVWACYLNQASNTVFNNYGVVASPSIQNQPVTSITTTSATFNGLLVSTGASACAVGVYWGTDTNAWANTNWFNGGAVNSSWTNNTPFSTNIASGINPDTTYYYSFGASNAAASVVASGPIPFITGNVWIDKLSDASEIGPVPGTFTVHRASAATNAALVVNYTVGGTAGNGSDYTHLPGTITIPAGTDAVALVVSPVADHFMEGTETVSVTIASGAYPIGASSNAALDIADAGMISLTWNGAGANALASTPANWVGNAAPVAGDGIVLDATTNKNMTWNLNIAVGAWTQVGYAGTVTVNTVYSGAFTNLTITGDCIISNGVWTHNGNTTTQANKLDVSVGGSFVLGSNATISVNGRGLSVAQPWGAGTWRSGGSHGGRGGGYGGVSGPCYGSITAPVTLGSDPSPGGAGGAIRLAVSGATTLNGSMSANALPHVDDPGQGSGGSVFLTTSNLTGSGSITANGAGNSTYGDKGRGGGGRIAVILTGDTNFASVTMTAYAGANNGEKGGAGTIYLRTKDQGPTDGTLIVKGDANSTDWTDISSQVSDASVGDVLIQSSYGKLRITNQTLNVSGVWSNGSSFAASSGGTVRFVGTNTARIYGNSAFNTLLCTNAGKRIEFAAGSSNSVTTALTLTGDATSNLFLRSTSNGNQWKINVTLSVTPSLSYLDVQDSDANPGKKLVALNSVGPLQNNLNWDFGSVGQTNTWIGVSSTTWGLAANWDKNRAPIPEDARVIIASGTYAPILPSAQTFNNLDIQNGASLRLNGFGIVVNESATIAGALIASNTETVVFKGNTDFTGGSFTSATSTVIIGGTNAQVITPAANTFYTVRVTNTAGVVTFANAFATTFLRSESASVTYGGNLTATEARLYSTGGTVTQTFNAASTYAIRDLVVPVSGANGISLRSSNSGSAWLLNVSRSAFVRNATVQDSNADGGILIHAMNSTDVSGNSNWDFGGTWGLWTGGTSTSFTNALNWSPAVAPDASTRVVIDGGYGANAPVIATAASIRQLVLGTEQASALTANAPLTVGEDVTVGGFGTLTLNRPSTVSNNVTVLTGGRTMHGDNGTTEANKLNLAIGGNLVLDTGADIYADGKGYDSNQGTGSPSAGSYRYAGSYGGRGGIGGGSGTNGPTYGSILAPTNCGSGGYGYNAGADGGGAIRLAVSGNTTLNGTITANGNPIPGNATGAGAGGSIWLTTANLSGSGTIRARGGAGGNNNGDNGGGGGGRIAVILANGTTFGSVAMQAYGGVYSNLNGGAGTIYRQTAGQPNGAGTVTIDNGNQPAALTQIPPATNAVPDELKKVSLVVTNRGAMAVTTNAMVEALTVVSTNELLNLGTSNTVLTVKALNVNGTNYTRQGFYMTNNWNDYTPVPVNVTGAGSISLIGMKGTVFTLR